MLKSTYKMTPFIKRQEKYENIPVSAHSFKKKHIEDKPETVGIG